MLGIAVTISIGITITAAIVTLFAVAVGYFFVEESDHSKAGNIIFSVIAVIGIVAVITFFGGIAATLIFHTWNSLL